MKTMKKNYPGYPWREHGPQDAKYHVIEDISGDTLRNAFRFAVKRGGADDPFIVAKHLTRAAAEIFAWSLTQIADHMVLQAWPGAPGAPRMRSYGGSTDGIRIERYRQPPLPMPSAPAPSTPVPTPTKRG